jgi:hypothetical protein
LTFQARPFYERFGYGAAGDLSEHPPGHAYYFMRRALV